MKGKEVSNINIISVMIILIIASFFILAIFPLQNPTGLVIEEKALDKVGDHDLDLTIDFDKEYTGVKTIEYEVTPGGEWCAASMNINVYDVLGRNVGDYRTARGDTHVKIKGSFPLEDAKVKSINADAVPDADFWSLDCWYVDYFKANLIYEKDENPPEPLGSPRDITETKVAQGSHYNPTIDFGQEYQNVVGLTLEGTVTGDWWCGPIDVSMYLWSKGNNEPIATLSSSDIDIGYTFKVGPLDLTTNQINLIGVSTKLSSGACNIKDFKATVIRRGPPIFNFESISVYPSAPTTADDVTIEARGTDNMNDIYIYVDNHLEQNCKTNVCSVTKKYSAGAHTYMLGAYSTTNQDIETEEKQFIVASVPNTKDTTKPSINHTGSIPVNPKTDETVKLVATMYDNVGVTKVEIFIDGTLKRRCTDNPPITYCATDPKYYSAGMHKYTVKAYDAAGNMRDIGGQNDVQWFTVTQVPDQQQSSTPSGSSSSSEDSQPPASPTPPAQTPQGDTTPPTFSLLFYVPYPNPKSTDPITVTTTSEDPSGISKIEIFVDNVKTATCSSSPCSTTPKTFTAGTHYYYVKSYDTLNNVATSQTKPIEILPALPPPDTTPPRITISYAKPQFSKLGNSFTISANAQDPSGIGKIDLYLNNNLIKTCIGTTVCTSEPILVKLSLDKYTYHAEATDSVGNFGREPAIGEAKMVFVN